MAISAGNAGSWRTPTVISVGAGGSWHTVQNAWAGAGGVWRLCYTNLSASLSVPSVSGSAAAPGTATTGPCTCNVTGGTAPYTYTWNLLTGQIGADFSAAATTTFSRGGGTPQVFTATYNCTVTDAGGSTATTVTLNVTCTLT